ncbi:MAG: GAF domain-containing protein [Bacteroidales bacterium]
MKVRFSIANKLILGITVIIVAILINSYIIDNSLEKSRLINHQVSEIYVPSTTNLDELHNVVNRSKALIKNWVFIEKRSETPEKIRLRQLHNHDLPELHEKIAELSENWDKEEKEQYEQIITSIQDTLFKEHQEIMESLNTMESYNDPMLMFEISPKVEENGEIINQTDKILSDISELRQSMQLKVEASRTQMNNIFDRFKNSIIILGITLTVIAIIIALILTRTIIRPINRIKKVIIDMCKGILPARKLKETNDEVGDISAALNDLVDSFRKFTTFANEIGNGNYDISFTPLSDEDDLGNALLEMRDNLKKASEEEAKRKQEDEQRHWASQGIAKFSGILRENNDDIEELSYQIIRNLVKYTSANQGGLFIINDDDENEKFIELKAAYAFNKRKYMEKQIDFGVGLIGRAVQEKETIYMNELPENYINITSGLGDANPRSLLIVPLKTNEQVHGAIELATFKDFEQYQIEFIERIAENIASTLASVKINIKTNELLERTQQQAEEMKAQEEEMRQNMEELQATQEESTRREKELKEKLEDCERELREYKNNRKS